ncbi:MAG: binding-protein-dependent transport system inner rane component [Thermomicrobiales bacterium]|jgi:ABC-type dipeptide/oligopeptide/nickel transport system permease component|nr:binding-protein-dependent transport system inner rane component [Thermomicrobiales bacterium]MCD6058991.1 binding-protein-dependent transport system inner rane component [Thermomicrobiales bacterium]MDF2758566.1 binding-protein-dependent transport system inner rane component [Thermomicrobiales bacterium]
MGRYIAGRSLQAIPVVVATSIVVFLILHLAPGDPVRMLASPTATEQDLANLRSRLGLDQPLPIQYGRWMASVLQGDMGESLRSGAPVLEILPERYWNTIRLTLASMMIAAIVGLLAGLAAAARPGSFIDVLTTTVAVAGLSIPPFWLGLILILVFSVQLGWLPAGGGDSWHHLILPAISLGTATAALIARMVRSSLLEVIRTDYVRTGRAKGLREDALILGHALPNALIPTITVFGLQFGTLLAGAVITEVVFSWPGIGSLLVTSILNRDFPVVQATLLVVSLTFLVVNLLTDLLYFWVDPRIRIE